MLSNYGAAENSWKSLGQQGDQTSQSWIFIGRTGAEAKAPIPWLPGAKSWLIGKDPDAGKDWGQEKEGETATQWTWVWVNSRREWQTGEPGILQPMGSQRVTYNLATTATKMVIVVTESSVFSSFFWHWPLKNWKCIEWKLLIKCQVDDWGETEGKQWKERQMNKRSWRNY